MTNPNTDTVEAVARAIRVEARAAIAAMPGSGEAMREAAAETAFIQSKQGATHRQIAAAIRALPLPPAQEG